SLFPSSAVCGRKMALFCTFESTFIAVKEPCAQAPRRSKSADAIISRKPCEATSYVESLEQRSAQLGRAPPEEQQAPCGDESENSIINSAGSVGHPELCYTPCIFWAWRCPKGAACDFCHMPHAQQKKLTRAERQMVAQMDESDLLALILPHLRAKDLPPAESFLRRLEVHLASLPPGRQRQSSALMRLDRKISRHSFRSLVRLWRPNGSREMAQLMQIATSASLG
ncbi:unnamed protein product, partial [Effrenium voratum]